VNEFTAHGVSGARIETLIWGLAGIIASSLLPAVFISIQSYLNKVQGNEILQYTEKLQFEKMDELDIGTVEQPEFQDMLERVNQRGWNAMMSIISNVTNSFRQIVALIVATVSLLVLSPLVLVIIFITTTPTYLLEKKNAEMSADLWKSFSETRRRWNSKTTAINNKNILIELKNFKLVSVFWSKWQSAINVYHLQAKDLNKKTAINEVGATVLLSIGYAVAFVLIMLKVYSGALLIGSLVYSFSVISRFQSALQVLFENFGRISEHKKNFDSFIDLFEMKPLIVSGGIGITAEQFEILELKNVSFSYPSSPKKVIENVSLNISKGRNLAIVGLNGAGKTTLIKLILRVYDPTEGEILVNGVNLKEYDLDAWKRCLGILLQDYWSYNEETISENIMFGDMTKQDQAIVELTAKETTADEYIQELPEKYNQKVGTEFKGGIELSKGQKQKLALARVFYRNAPIMILDEPTAAIDALSEDTIFKNLKNNHANQTRIIISHKFSNVRDADHIILIEHGKIIEQGNHEKLMKKRKGKYKELFNLQAEGYR
jgi:ATP-binding cassette subfamily B protein